MLSGGLMRPCAPAEEAAKKTAQKNTLVVDNLLKLLTALI
jgi:hypothetical protein